MTDRPLPEYRVKARNASANRENRIHGHAVAGAGIASVCFLRPVLEGERLEGEGLEGEGVVVTRAVTVRDARRGRSGSTSSSLASHSAPGRPAGTAAVATAQVGVDGYRGAGGLVHPAFFPEQANLALSRNARLGLWIRLSNAVYERGQGSVERDLAIVAEPAARPVAHVLHTSIHRLPAPAR